MNIPSPAEMPVVSYNFHRGHEAVDRGALIIALLASIVAGVVTAQGIESVGVGIIIGSVLFALLAPLLSAASR